MNERRLGRDFDAFLAEEGLAEEAQALATKRVLAFRAGEVSRQDGPGAPQSGKTDGGGQTLKRKAINPATAPPPLGGYSQAIEVQGASRLLFVSGQIPEAVDGSNPAGFDAQCEAVWQNLGQVLAAAGMGYENLIKVTTFLTDPGQAERNGEIRRRFLGELRPALTVVVVATLDSKWLLEIEAMAAA